MKIETRTVRFFLINASAPVKQPCSETARDVRHYFLITAWTKSRGTRMYPCQTSHFFHPGKAKPQPITFPGKPGLAGDYSSFRSELT